MSRLIVAVSIVLAAASTVAGQFRTAVDVVRVEALVADNGRADRRALGGRLHADRRRRRADDHRPPARRRRDRRRRRARYRARASAARVWSIFAPGDRRAAWAASPRSDRATLIAFSHQLAFGPADAAPETLRPRLATLAADGATSLIDAATAALVWGTGRGRPILVLVFSDGRDTASWTRVNQAFALARTSDAVVDAVVTSERTMADAGQTTVENRRGRPVFRVSAETSAQRRALAAGAF